MSEKTKKPIFKKWWFWAIIVIIVIGALGSGGERETPSANTKQEQNKEESKTADTIESKDKIDESKKAEEPKKEEPKKTTIKAGNYKVGTDLPAGEYKIYTDDFMGYFEVSKDSSGNLDSIIVNDNFTTFTYLTVSEGQYLKLQMCYAIPVEEAEPYKSDKGYGSGKYKVGVDIPAGEYNVKKEEGQLFGYVEVSKDSKGTLDSIISNDNFENNKYVTIKDGQYLKIQFGYIE